VVKKIHEDLISFFPEKHELSCGKIPHLCNVEKSFKKFLDPDLDDFPNLTSLSSSTDTSVVMGVDHGETGGLVPQNLERGTLMQIVPPPDFVI